VENPQLAAGCGDFVDEELEDESDEDDEELEEDDESLEDDDEDESLDDDELVADVSAAVCLPRLSVR
jgi:hypothetical protein